MVEVGREDERDGEHARDDQQVDEDEFVVHDVNVPVFPPPQKVG